MANENFGEFADWFGLVDILDNEGIPMILDTTRVRLRENRRELDFLLRWVHSLRAQIGYRTRRIRCFGWLSDRPSTPWERYVRSIGLTDRWVLIVENRRLGDELAIAKLDLTILRLTGQELQIQLQLDQLPAEPRQ